MYMYVYIYTRVLIWTYKSRGGKLHDVYLELLNKYHVYLELLNKHHVYLELLNKHACLFRSSE